MHLKVDRLFARLEAGRTAILSELSGWPEGLLERRPAAGAWSAVDVIDHVVKLEHASVEGVRENLPYGHAVSFPERVKALGITLAMRMPVRIPIGGDAKLAFLLPSDGVSLAEIRGEWAGVRGRLGETLETGGTWTGRGFYLHPIAGWISMPDLLALLDSHQRHHVYQLRRLRGRFGEG